MTAEVQPDARLAPRRAPGPLIATLFALLAALVTVVPAHLPAPPPTWAETTGVPAGTNFTTVWGDLEVVNPGTVIDSVDVHGKIIVLARNVTIRNSRIRGADGGSTGGLIDAMAGKPGLRVQDSEIFAAAPNPRINGVMGSGFTLDRVEIRNVIDHVHIVGSNVTVENSWFHDNLHYAHDPAHHDGPSHDDNVQIQAGSNITISGNLLTGSHNAVVQVTQDLGPVSGLTFAHNEADGGWCSINVSQGAYGPIADIALRDNVFGRSMVLKDCAVISPGTTQVAVAGNHFEDGGAIAVRPGGR